MMVGSIYKMWDWLKKTVSYREAIESVEDESQELSKRAKPPIVDLSNAMSNRNSSKPMKTIDR